LWYILRCTRFDRLELSTAETVDKILHVRPIVPLLEDIELIKASLDTKEFFNQTEERTTTRKRVITGEGGGDSDDEAYDEERQTDMREQLLAQPKDIYIHEVLQRGYEFLLMDTEQQVRLSNCAGGCVECSRSLRLVSVLLQMWFFVEQLIRLLPTNEERISVLHFVFQLSYCTPGRQ